MVGNNDEGLVEWRPEFSGEKLERYEKMRAELTPQISLLRKLRTSLGLSQTELAQLLGVTQSNVSKIEARDDPTLSVLAKLVESKGAKLRLNIQTAEGDELSFRVA